MKPATITRVVSIDAALEVLCRALEDRHVVRIDVERTPQSFFVRTMRRTKRVRPTSGEAVAGVR